MENFTDVLIATSAIVGISVFISFIVTLPTKKDSDKTITFINWRGERR